MSEKHMHGRLKYKCWHGKEGLCGANLVVGGYRLPLCSAETGPSDNWEYNARRLVACWNACDGLDTESIEEGDKTTRVRLMHQIREIRIQRDELLALLEEAIGYLCDTDPDSEFVAGCEETIAKVKGGAA